MALSTAPSRDILGKKEETLRELDKIAKMLVRRDLELSQVRRQREKELVELKAKTEELEKSEMALMNILEDTEGARARIEEERDKTQLIVASLTDGLLVFNAAGNLELVNPVAKQILNVEEYEFEGKTFEEIARLPSFQPLLKVVGKDLPEVFRQELALGSQKTIEVSTIPFLVGKERKGSLLVLHDITREKRIEKLKTEFVSLSAHQLRTPLSAIKWTLHMFLDGDLGPLTEEQKSFIEKTRGANDRMINLVNDLLDVTRIEEGRYLYRPKPAHIEDIIKTLIKFYSEQAERRGIHFIVDLPKKKTPKVFVDDEKMRLAIQNILENALAYTLKGGKVTIRVKHDTKKVEIVVVDTGIGIPEKEQGRVFEKFFRAQNARRVETEGSGLGLYIVKNIIEAHKGSISLKSKENEGTTLSLAIPIGQPKDKKKNGLVEH